MGSSTIRAELLSHGPTMPVPAACKELGISKSHGYEAIRRGEFPARVLKVGGRYLVVTESLADSLEGDDAA